VVVVDDDDDDGGGYGEVTAKRFCTLSLGLIENHDHDH